MASNAISFNREIMAWTAQLEQRDWLPFIRYIVMTFLRDVVYMTPVKTGRLRGNWQVGGDSDVTVNQDASLIAYDKQGGVTILRGLSALDRVATGETVYVFNNIEYSGEINFGTAYYQGYHMVEKALANLRGMVPGSAAA